MSTLRLCRCCFGPIPRAARRCPWCHAERSASPKRPEHLYATYDGQRDAVVPPPPDAARLGQRD